MNALNILEGVVRISVDDSKLDQGLKAVKDKVQAADGGGKWGALKNVSQAASGGVMGMIGAAGPQGAAIAAAVGAVRNLAAAANPAALQRFDTVLKDVNAVIGRVFVPILNLASTNLRVLGDLLATMLPSSKEMEQVMKPLGQLLLVLKDALMPLAQIIREVLVGALTALAKTIQWVVDGSNDYKNKFYESKVSGKVISGKDRGPGWDPFYKEVSKERYEEQVKAGKKVKMLFKGTDGESSVNARPGEGSQMTDPMSYYKQIAQASMNFASGEADPQKELVAQGKRHNELLELLKQAVEDAAPAVGP